MASLNINHKEGKIEASDNEVVIIADKAAVLVGSGSNLDDLGDVSNIEPLSKYAGGIRFNHSTNTLQYCDGTSWLDFSVSDISKIDTNIVWSILF